MNSEAKKIIWATEVVIEQVNGSYISQSITERAEATAGTLLIMAASTSGGREAFPGSITRQVIRKTNTPILVLPCQ